MKSWIESTVLTAFIAATPAIVSAETRDWYATGAFGLVTQSDQQLTFTRPGVSGTVTPTIPLDTGFLAGGSVGRYVGEDWRIEAEFMYQSVDHPVFTLVAGGPGLPSGDGNYASTSIALNALREFYVGPVVLEPTPLPHGPHLDHEGDRDEHDQATHHRTRACCHRDVGPGGRRGPGLQRRTHG